MSEELTPTHTLSSASGSRTVTPTRTAGPTRTPPPTPTPSPKDIAAPQIDALLLKRAAAALQGDRAAFMATVSLRDPDILALEEQLFENLSSLPLSSLRFSFDASRGFVSTVRQDWRWDNVAVEWSYSWEGQEDREHAYELEYDFGQEDGVWKVVDSGEVAPEKDWWLRAPLLYMRTDSFLIVFHEDFSAMRGAASSILEEAYQELATKVSSATGVPPDPPYIVWITSDGLPFGGSEFFQLTNEVDPVVGQTRTRRQLGPDGFGVTSQLIILNGETLTESGETAFRQAVQLELAQALLDSVTTPYTPAWLRVGAASDLAGAQIDFDRIVSAYDTVFEPWFSLEFVTDRTGTGLGLPAPGLRAAYSFYHAVTAYVIETYGEEAFWDLYLSYGRASPEVIHEELESNPFFSAAITNLAKALTDQFLREQLGMTEVELDYAVKDWIDGQLAQ